MLENNFWRHRLVTALAKASLPGMVILSPTCRPDTDSTIEVSRWLMPVTFIEPMVYSFGILAFCNASKLGSTEVGWVVSCAAAVAAIKKTQEISIISRGKKRCMVNIQSVSIIIRSSITSRRSLGSKLKVIFKRFC